MAERLEERSHGGPGSREKQAACFACACDFLMRIALH